MLDEATEPTLSLFISHRKEDRSLAEKIRDKLAILGNRDIRTFLFHDIQGGEKWQEEIEKQLRQSHVLLFLFTDSQENWRWCLYETGFFKGSKNDDISQIICIKNKNIDPPSPLQNLQAYNSSAEGIEKFLRELLQDGKFCDGKVINDSLEKDFRVEFNRAVEEIVSEFSEGRKLVDYFDKRISIELKPPEQIDQPVTLDGAIINGDPATMKMLGIEPDATWQHLVEEQTDRNAVWLEEIRKSVARIQDKKSARQIMPGFEINGQYFTPLLSRIERVGDRPERLSIIFVESNLLIGADNMESDTFKDIPQRYKQVLALLNITMQLRWGVLEKHGPMMTIRRPVDLKAFCGELISELDTISNQAQKLGFTSLPDVMEPLAGQNRDELLDAIRLYAEGVDMLRNNLEAPEHESIRSALDKIETCNRQFIVACARIIESAVTR